MRDADLAAMVARLDRSAQVLETAQGFDLAHSGMKGVSGAGHFLSGALRLQGINCLRGGYSLADSVPLGEIQHGEKKCGAEMKDLPRPAFFSVRAMPVGDYRSAIDVGREPPIDAYREGPTGLAECVSADAEIALGEGAAERGRYRSADPGIAMLVIGNGDYQREEEREGSPLDYASSTTRRKAIEC
jgi:hypothetical protein